jgi:CheY-like chemotaxis protein
MIEESFVGHVLVVDDDRSVLSILSHILERDYAVSTVTSGAEALEILETRLVDLVLLDIMMPEMDGIEVCAAIQANPKIRDLPVIFLTGMEDEGAEEAALAAAGAVDYISKPVRPRVVESRVRLQMQNSLYLQFLENVLSEKDTTIETLRTEVRTLLDSTSQPGSR